jgi:hypothetical protein
MINKRFITLTSASPLQRPTTIIDVDKATFAERPESALKTC